MMVVVGGVVKWKGYIDKARPDNSRGFTALGLLYEMLEESVARSRAQKLVDFSSRIAGANAWLPSSRAGTGSQPKAKTAAPAWPSRLLSSYRRHH
jgi:hypothetical protein